MGKSSGSFEAPGRRLRLVRMLKGMTITQVAAKADVDMSHLALIEKGQRRASPLVARRIAKALGSSLEKMLAEGILVAQLGDGKDAE